MASTWLIGCGDGFASSPATCDQVRRSVLLAVPPSRDALYAVNEGEDYPQPDGSKGGSVSAFQRDAASGKLQTRKSCPLAAPVLATSRSIVRPAAFVANYNNGTLARFASRPRGWKAPSRSLRARQRPTKGGKRPPSPLHHALARRAVPVGGDLGTATSGSSMSIRRRQSSGDRDAMAGETWIGGGASYALSPERQVVTPSTSSHRRWMYWWDAKNGTLKECHRCPCAILLIKARAMPRARIDRRALPLCLQSQ